MKSSGMGRSWKMHRQLPPAIRTAARRAYDKFRQDPSRPSLSLERLRSDPRGWCFRVTEDYRAVARREGDEWLWVWIGTHKDFDLQCPK